MGLFKKDIAEEYVPGVQPASQPSVELPFLLQPGERLEASAMNVQYRGPSQVANTAAVGSSLGMGFGGFGRTKTMKRENSALDATNCDLYLTDRRLVLIRHGMKGGISAEVPLNAIKALSAGKVLTGHNIQLSVPGPEGITNAMIVMIARLHGEDRLREAERDKLFAKTKELMEAAIRSSSTPSPSGEDPLKVLALRFARGEITKEEYEEMKGVLS